MSKIQTPLTKNLNFKNNNNFYSPNINSFNSKYEQKFDFSNKKFNKYIITLKNIKDTFKLFAIDQKYLNMRTFDAALEYLFSKFLIPVLHHTHLSRKLFIIFDTIGNSKLNEEQFITCIKEILSNNENRLHLSMMAMMTVPNKARKKVGLDELKNFFYESFVQGYKHIAWVINQKPDEFKIYGFPVMSVSNMEAWAREFEKKIRNGFEKDLKMFDSSINDNISFEQYKKWIYKDQTLYIKYGFKTLFVATSLIGFDEFAFQE